MEKLDVIHYPSEPYGVKYEDITLQLKEVCKEYPKILGELAVFLSSVYARHITQDQSKLLLRFVEDLPVCVIWKAIMHHISHCAYPPTPVDLKNFAILDNAKQTKELALN